jgi:hypothetical protein
MRFFNTAGPVDCDKHYCLPPLQRLELAELAHLIEQEKYFVLHAPRQTGKTSCLLALMDHLNEGGRFRACYANLENAQAAREDVARGMETILAELGRSARYQLDDSGVRRLAREVLDEHGPFDALTELLTRWAEADARPLVLLLDEVDSLVGDTLISLLRQIRSGYPRRPARFPQTVVLCGVRDVRDYRLRSARDNAVITGGSAFNIKAASLRLGDFSPEEVEALMAQHTAETGQGFAPEAVEAVWSLTRGQPWLVNALCYEVTFRIPEGRDRSQTLGSALIREAAERLIERRETHLDQLVDKLKEDRVRRVIEPILVGSVPADATYDEDFAYVQDLGLVAVRQGVRCIANPIYQEVIPRVLTHQTQTAVADDPAWYVAADGTLDMPRFIDGFLRFWKRHGEVLLRGMPYHEAAPHLTFMAFLQRIVNHGGHVEREFAVGTGRADLVVDYGGRQDVIELKLKRGSYTLSDGLEQVSRYAQRLGRDVGYLVIFDPQSDEPWEKRGEVEEVAHEGVTVVVARA